MEDNRPVRIREATPADAGAIAAIGTVEFARIHGHLLGQGATSAVVTQTYTREAIAESIARCSAVADAHFLVAEREDRVVGYLHYDSFGSEPELHRIYLAEREVGRGTGSQLIDELHARIGPYTSYILMVVLDNETARRFYARHGLVEERRIPDGTKYYRDTMGVGFPTDTAPVPAAVLRRPSKPPD